MHETTATSADGVLTEVRVQVPSDRIASFYALVAEWLRAPSGVARHARRRGSGRTRRRANVGSKYEPLGAHLAQLGDDAVTLGFDEIEDLLGTDLPSSARKHRAWWANSDAHSQAAVWLEQGWHVSGVAFEEGRVTFART